MPGCNVTDDSESNPQSSPWLYLAFFGLTLKDSPEGVNLGSGRMRTLEGILASDGEDPHGRVFTVEGCPSGESAVSPRKRLLSAEEARCSSRPPPEGAGSVSITESEEKGAFCQQCQKKVSELKKQAQALADQNSLKVSLSPICLISGSPVILRHLWFTQEQVFKGTRGHFSSTWALYVWSVLRKEERDEYLPFTHYLLLLMAKLGLNSRVANSDGWYFYCIVAVVWTPLG
ncbi:hypothetical protein GOODEAATRI_021511 [Goodea atripinnis]|uniref:Uncharacterized protein n=1 Tax=Goodea atripinnis TaxID=208336 RepID=A0ABV0NN67_9TELE